MSYNDTALCNGDIASHVDTPSDAISHEVFSGMGCLVRAEASLLNLLANSMGATLSDRLPAPVSTSCVSSLSGWLKTEAEFTSSAP